MQLPRRFSRQELYDLVWSEPIVKLAERFSISGVGLAKACKRADIPVPERGYWAKAKHGKEGRRIPLPQRGLGMTDMVTIGGQPWQRFYPPHPTLQDPIPVRPAFPNDLEEIAQRVRKTVGRVTVSRVNERFHPLIASLLEDDEKRRVAYEGAKYKSFVDKPLFDTPLEQRRLRLLNALFVAFTRFGAKPWIDRKTARAHGVTVGVQQVSFTLDRPNAKRDPHRSGTLRDDGGPNTLQLGTPSWTASNAFGLLWKDEAKRPLESLLSEIATGLIVLGERYYRNTILSHHEWWLTRRAELEAEERHKKEEANRIERERIRQLEQKRIDGLLGQANALRQARDIRSYVADVRASVASSESVASDELGNWSSWAIAQADRIDPVKSGAFLELIRQTQAHGADSSRG
jgi:hypothetical protein